MFENSETYIECYSQPSTDEMRNYQEILENWIIYYNIIGNYCANYFLIQNSKENREYIRTFLNTRMFEKEYRKVINPTIEPNIIELLHMLHLCGESLLFFNLYFIEINWDLQEGNLNKLFFEIRVEKQCLKT